MASDALAVDLVGALTARQRKLLKVPERARPHTFARVRGGDGSRRHDNEAERADQSRDKCWRPGPEPLVNRERQDAPGEGAREPSPTRGSNSRTPTLPVEGKGQRS